MATLDPRLEDAKRRMEDWLGLRNEVAGLGYSHAAELVERCTSRIRAELSPGSWPLVWWRFLSIDAAFSDMSTCFFRWDSEGMFYGSGPDGYAPARGQILQRVGDLHAKDVAAVRRRSELKIRDGQRNI
jgi:hypothetical protein